jgi:CTP:phosphocholine cytidylyltransferase-like protein
MLKFVNFIREDCDILAEIGVAIVVNDELYDIEFIYNQAFQEYNMLSSFQVSFM